MNFFCRILGHTWVMKADDPKIRWTTEPKKLNQLELTAEGEPSFYRECVRCREREAIQPSGSAPGRSTAPGPGVA